MISFALSLAFAGVGLAVLAVVGLILFLAVGLPFALVFGLAPWVLGVAGVVLLVKAILDKPVRTENLMPAVLMLLASGLLRWIF